MQENDPKHTSKLAKSALEINIVNVLKWPAQSPDLNPIENLWNDVAERIKKQKTRILTDLWQDIQNPCYSIFKQRCEV